MDATNGCGVLLEVIEVKYSASPGLQQGTWAVIKQRSSHDPGYAVVSDLMTRTAAEAEARRLNAALLKEQQT